MNTKHLLGVAIVSMGALLSAPSQAVTCRGTLVGTTCTLAGPNVTWIYDILTDATPMVLYDAPYLVGDAIRFLPPSFRAESLNGAGAVTASANFIFNRVFRNAGGFITGISSSDIGDYAITLGDKVSADLYLQAADNNNFLGFWNNTNHFESVLPTGGVATPWSLTTAIVPVGATDLAVNVQNNLFATTNASGEDAWIQKKIQLDVLVPVPAAAWLFGSALAGLVGIRKRRAA